MDDRCIKEVFFSSGLYVYTFLYGNCNYFDVCVRCNCVPPLVRLVYRSIQTNVRPIGLYVYAYAYEVYSINTTPTLRQIGCIPTTYTMRWEDVHVHTFFYSCGVNIAVPSIP
jgi:hypothetical protein